MEDVGLDLHTPIPSAVDPVYEFPGYSVVYSCNVQFESSEPDFTEKHIGPLVHTTRQHEPIFLVQVKSSTDKEPMWKTQVLQYPGVPNTGVEYPYLEFAITISYVNTFVRLYNNTDGLCKIYLQKRDPDTHRVGKLLWALYEILRRTKTLKIKPAVLNQEMRYISNPVHAPTLRIVFMILYKEQIKLEQLGLNDRVYTIDFADGSVRIDFKRDTERVTNVSFKLSPTSQRTLQSLMQEYVHAEDCVKSVVVESQDIKVGQRDALVALLSQMPGFVSYDTHTNVFVFVKYGHCVISVGLEKLKIYALKQGLDETTSRELMAVLEQTQTQSAVEMILL